MKSFSQFISIYSLSTRNNKIKIADSSYLAIIGKGNAHNFTIIYPNLSCNLLSISKITKSLNCRAIFHPLQCEFQDMISGRTIGNARESGDLYYLEDRTNFGQDAQSTCFKSIFNSDDVILWHYRLGHPSFIFLRQLFPYLFKNKNPSLFQCKFCEFAKH